MVIVDLYYQITVISTWLGLVKVSKRKADRCSKERLLANHVSTGYKICVSTISHDLKHWQRISGDLDGSKLAIPWGTLSGNGEIHRALLASLSGKISCGTEILKEFKAIMRLGRLRSNSTFELSDYNSFKEGTDSELSIKLLSIHESLNCMYLNSCKASERIILRSNLGDSVEAKGGPDKLDIAGLEQSLGDLGLVSLGSLVLVRLGRTTVCLTTLHFERLLETLLSYRNYLIGSEYILGPKSNKGGELLKYITSVADSNPEALGEWLKAARNVLIAELSRDNIMGVQASKLLCSAYDGQKESMMYKMLDRYHNMFDDKYSTIQMSHLYKYIPQPDVDIVECFQSVVGVCESNPIDIKSMPSLIGTIKRSFFRASLKSGEALRICDGDPYILQEISKPSPDYKRISDVPIERWIPIVFEVQEPFCSYLNIDLRVMDKSHCSAEVSSQPKVNWTRDKQFLLGKVEKAFLGKSYFESDLYSHYIKGDNPSCKDSRDYFAKIVDKHIAFENKYAGGDPDKVTPEMLQTFRSSDPEAFHCVATEPKSGEKHKEVTRMFYLANLKMKKYLSLVERLCKNITKSQLGNSITKNYKSRESDLRSYAHSASGVWGEAMTVLLSFDMSQFSKKFPGQNLRCIGSILSDLTGDPILKRLDIAFRSAVVAHNTRGICADFSGVFGGFEGFLNFNWTALHVCIMETALREAGVSGAVLAYSDDGVLYFMIKGPLELARAEIQRIVLVIQGAYAKLGLIFHIGKTLISATTFEYLGEVSDSGRFIETYVKPLAAFSIIEKTTSLQTVSTTMDTFIGQARATCNSGFPSCLIEPHLLYHGYLKLKRLSPGIPIVDAFCILILPRCLGGFGLPSSMTMSVNYDTDSTIEFLSDLVIMGKKESKVSSRLASYIDKHMCDDQDSDVTYLMGNSLRSNCPDTSGISVLMSAANCLRTKNGGKEVNHPLNRNLTSCIIGVISNTIGFTPSLINSIIMKSPDMIAFELALSEGRSKGALKQLGHDKLRSLQAKDTRLVKQAIDQFKSFSSTNTSVNELINRVSNQLVRKGFLPLRLAPRSYISLTDTGKYMVNVIVDLIDHAGTGLGSVPPATSFNLPYYHEAMQVGASLDKLEFSSENSDDNNIPYKLIKQVSLILSHNPEASIPLRAIVAYLGYSAPSVVATGGAGTSRIRAMSNKSDINLNINPMFMARSTVLPNHEMEKIFSSGESMNRTLLSPYSIALASEIVTLSGCLHLKPQTGKLIVSYSISNPECIFKVTRIKARSYIEVPIPRHTIRPDKLRDMSRKLEDDFLCRDRVDNILDIGGTTPESLPILMKFLAGKIKRRIEYRVSGITTEDNLQPAYIETSALQLNLSTYRETIMLLMEDDFRSGKELSDCKTALVNKLRERLVRLPVEFLSEDVMNSIVTRDMLRHCTIVSASDSLFGNSQVLVVDNGFKHAINPYYRGVRCLLDQTIKRMYQKGFDEKWKEDRVGKITLELGSNKLSMSERGISMDNLITWCAIGYDSIRGSSHRRLTYNPTTYTILYVKYLYSLTLGPELSEKGADTGIKKGPSLNDSTKVIYEAGRGELVSGGLCGSEQISYDNNNYSGTGEEDLMDDGDESEIYDGFPNDDDNDAYKIPNDICEYLINRHKLGPDHQRLLKSSLSGKSRTRSGVIRRLMVKQPYLVPPHRSADEVWDDARNSQSVYKETVETVISRKITILDKRFVPDKISDYQIMKAFLPQSINPGYARNPFDFGLDTNMTSIIWYHLIILQLSEGIDVVSLENLPNKLVNSIPKTISLSLDGMPVRYRNCNSAGIMIVNEYYSTASKAVSSLADLSVVGPYSLDVIQDNDGFRLLGVVLLTGPIDPNHELNPKFDNEDFAMSMVPGSIEAYIVMLSSRSGCYLGRSASVAPQSSMVEYGGLTIITKSRRTKHIRGHNLLRAASLLASGGNTYAQAIYSYCLVKAHLNGGNLESARNFFEKITDLSSIQSRSSKMDRITALKTAASCVRGYFSVNPLDSYIDDEPLSDYVITPDCSISTSSKESTGLMFMSGYSEVTLPLDDLANCSSGREFCIYSGNGDHDIFEWEDEQLSIFDACDEVGF